MYSMLNLTTNNINFSSRFLTKSTYHNIIEYSIQRRHVKMKLIIIKI